MNRTLKKIVVMLPVIIAGVVYLRVFYHQHYDAVSQKRLTGFILSILLFYLWVMLLTFRKRQDTFLQGLVQSSFFVYVFAVLVLTGYFILFREVAAHGWWEDMMQRVKRNDHVNLEPFRIFNTYDRFDKQIVGNLVMLLPLGVYLPLLHRSLRKPSGFFVVLLVSILVAVMIELLQLATRFRSTDVDDVILNVTGAVAGYIIYQLIRVVVVPRERKEVVVAK